MNNEAYGKLKRSNSSDRIQVYKRSLFKQNGPIDHIWHRAMYSL